MRVLRSGDRPRMRLRFAALGLVTVLAGCSEDIPIGGGWSVRNYARLPEAGVSQSDLIREIEGDEVVVATWIVSARGVEPECVVFRSVQHSRSHWAACGDRVPVRIAGRDWVWKDEELVLPVSADDPSAPPQKVLTMGEIKRLAYRSARLQ